MTALSTVERAVLEILADHHGEKVPGRDLRTALQNRGFRRSAPAFVFTMMNLADKGLVSCRAEVNIINGVEVRHRYYRVNQQEAGSPTYLSKESGDSLPFSF